jgi:hypothetical protein
MARKAKADETKKDRSTLSPREAFIERCYDILDYSDWSSDNTKGVLTTKWCIGGLAGGSCWGTGDAVYRSRSGEPEPEFKELDKLLMELRPQISYLQYKALTSKLVQTGDYRENDYYGNYTDYATKKVDLGGLYDYFQSKGWLDKVSPTTETAVADLNDLLAALNVQTVDEALAKILGHT